MIVDVNSRREEMYVSVVNVRTVFIYLSVASQINTSLRALFIKSATFVAQRAAAERLHPRLRLENRLPLSFPANSSTSLHRFRSPPTMSFHFSIGSSTENERFP